MGKEKRKAAGQAVAQALAQRAPLEDGAGRAKEVCFARSPEKLDQRWTLSSLPWFRESFLTQWPPQLKPQAPDSLSRPDLRKW